MIKKNMINDSKKNFIKALVEVDFRLKEFEREYGISTEQMREEVVTEKRDESERILTWLMLHNRKRCLEEKINKLNPL